MSERTRKVIWSRRANRDVSKVTLYYQKRNGNATHSLELLSRFEKATEMIEQNEEIGERIPDSRCRFVAVKPYKLIYRIDKHKIVVITVWDSRRNPDDLKVE